MCLGVRVGVYVRGYGMCRSKGLEGGAGETGLLG